MIIIADYIGHCDINGEPIGHPIKVINETSMLLETITEIGVAAPSKHLKQINKENLEQIITLKNSVCAFSKDKLGNFKKKWGNLRYIFNNCKNDYVWFINVDFSLFLFLLLSKKKKVLITFCYNPLKGVDRWRKRVIEAVLKKVDLIIVTNQNFLKTIPGEKIFIPDYYYVDTIYNKYLCKEKKDKMACLGTMGETKKLESLVDIMNNQTTQLLIAGNFSQNISRFKYLCKSAATNVRILNSYLENDEYYKIIAESKYIVLPYDMNLYDERTSGILLEAIFLHSIPIAPQKLLEYNSIQGIGYKTIDEIPSLLENNSINESIILNNEYLIKHVFSIKSIRNQLKEKLTSLSKES